jgi:sortase A
MPRPGVAREATPGRPAGGPAVSTRRRLSRALMVLGIALIAVAAGARLHSQLASEAGLERFREANAALAATAGASASTPAAADPDRSLWAEGRVAAWEQSQAVDLGTPTAVLRIGRLDLEVPVWPGIDELTLNKGLGAIPGTATPGSAGNVGLAGHRDGFFRVLEGIATGDEIELESLGTTQTYVVEKVWIVEPKDVWVLEPTPEPSLTLVTCYPFYFVGKAPNRFVVRARAAGEPLPEGGERDGGQGGQPSAGGPASGSSRTEGGLEG